MFKISQISGDYGKTTEEPSGKISDISAWILNAHEIEAWPEFPSEFTNGLHWDEKKQNSRNLFKVEM